MTETRNGRREVIEQILRIVAGPADVRDVARYMRKDVVVHMDSLTFRGLSGWQKWIRYSHAKCGLEATRFEILDIEERQPDHLRVQLQGHGRRLGRPVVSNPAYVTYRFSGNLVAETWTTRHNYRFFFGDRIRHFWYFAWLLFSIVTWCWIQDSFVPAERREP